MKKVALLLAIVIILATPLTVSAASPRLMSIMPEISFNGTTAECSVAVIGNYSTDDIDATIKLWRGNTCLRTWTASGEGYVFWDDTATVTKGYTYTLTVDVIINKVSKPRVSTSSTCD